MKRLVSLLLILALVLGLGLSGALAEDAPAAKLKAPTWEFGEKSVKIVTADGTAYASANFSGYDAEGNYQYGYYQYDAETDTYVLGEWYDDPEFETVTYISLSKSVSSEDRLKRTENSAYYQFDDTAALSSAAVSSTVTEQEEKETRTTYEDGTSSTGTELFNKSSSTTSVTENYNQDGRVTSFYESNTNTTYQLVETKEQYSGISTDTWKAVEATVDGTETQRYYNYGEDGTLTDSDESTTKTTAADGKKTVVSNTGDSNVNSETGKVISKSSTETKNSYTQVERDRGYGETGKETVWQQDTEVRTTVSENFYSNGGTSSKSTETVTTQYRPEKVQLDPDSEYWYWNDSQNSQNRLYESEIWDENGLKTGATKEESDTQYEKETEATKGEKEELHYSDGIYNGKSVEEYEWVRDRDTWNYVSNHSTTTEYDKKDNVTGTSRTESKTEENDDSTARKVTTTTTTESVNPETKKATVSGKTVTVTNSIRNEKDGMWQTADETTEGTRKVYHKLSGNLLKDSVESSETKNTLDKDGNLTSVTYEGTSNDKSYAYNRLVNEQTTKDTRVTTYAENASGGRTPTTKSENTKTEMVYNRYSGKLLYTDERTESSTAANDQTTESSSTFVRKDAEGQEIQSSSEKVVKSDVTDNTTGKRTETTTVTTEARDEENGKTSGTTVETYVYQDGRVESYTRTEEQKAGDQVTSSSKETRKQSQYDAEKEEYSNSGYELSSTSWDKDTGKKISESSSKNNTEYNKNGTMKSSTNSSASRTYDGETGAELSGSKRESTASYDENGNLSKSEESSESTGRDGKKRRVSSGKYEYDTEGKQISSETTYENYDRATGDLYSKTVSSTKAGEGSSSRTTNGAGKLISETTTDEKTEIKYNDEDETKATGYTETFGRTESRTYDGVNEEKPITTRTTRKVNTYVKDEEGVYQQDTAEEYTTKEDETGRNVVGSVTKFIDTESKTDEETGATTVVSRTKKTSTDDSYDLQDKLISSEETVREGTVTTVDTPAQKEEEKATRTKTEKAVSTTKNSKTNRTVVSSETTVTNYEEDDFGEMAQKDRTTTKEESTNGIKTLTSVKTETRVDTFPKDVENIEDKANATRGTQTVTVTTDPQGTTKITDVQTTDYEYTGDGNWNIVGNTSTHEELLNDEIVSKTSTSERNSSKTVESDDKTTKTEVTTRETVREENDEKTVTVETSATKYRKVGEEYQQTGSSQETKVNDVITYSLDNTYGSETSEDGKTVTSYNTTTETQGDADTGHRTSALETTHKTTSDEKGSTVTDSSKTEYFNAVSGKLSSESEWTKTRTSEATESYLGFTNTTEEENNKSASYWKDQKISESESSSAVKETAENRTRKSDSSSTGYSLQGNKTFEDVDVSEEKSDRAAQELNQNPDDTKWEETGYTYEASAKSYSKNVITNSSETKTERVYKDGKRTENTKTEGAYYNRAGEKNASYESETVSSQEKSKYSDRWLTLESTTARKNYNSAGKVTYSDASVTKNTYTDEGSISEYTREISQYDKDTGALRATTKYESTVNSDREIEEYSESFAQVKSTGSSRTVNADGTLISSQTDSSEEKEDDRGVWTESAGKTEAFDYLGNRVSGRSYQYTRDASHFETYGQRGLIRETDEKYDPENHSRIIQSTVREYSNRLDGKAVLSSEIVSTPEVRDADDNGPDELSHNVTTEYDRYGAVTKIETYDEAYNETTEKQTNTTTTVNYVAKDVQSRRTVEEEVDVKRTASNVYGSDDYSRITTVYDYNDEVKERTIDSRVTSGNVTVKTEAEYEDGNLDTPVKETVTESGYDENGHLFWKETRRIRGVTVYELVSDNTMDTESVTERDEKGSLIGTSASVGAYDEKGNYTRKTDFSDRTGNVTYTSIEAEVIGEAYKSTTWTDAEGKEIGYSKTAADGSKSEKIPKFKDYKPTGAWTEYTADKDKKETEQRVYNEEGKLESSDVYRDEVRTRTYYRNPGNVLSRQIITADGELDDEGSPVKSTRTDTWYNLKGEQDRKQVTTTEKKYDEYGVESTTTTTEYRDGADQTVVTKTEVNNAADMNLSTSQTVKADGTVIEYTRHSGWETKFDSSYSFTEGSTETLTADFNPYTGYVYSQQLTSTTYGADGSKENREQRINEKGTVTFESVNLEDKDGNVAFTSKAYENADDHLSETVEISYDARTLTTTGTAIDYRYSGAVASKQTSKKTYDAEKDVWTDHIDHYNSDGKLVFTEDITEKKTAEKAYTEYDHKGVGESSISLATIKNEVYRDAKGNEIGYYRTDEKGGISAKIPHVTYSGNLDGAYTLRTSDYLGDTVSSREYDKEGWLIRESTASENASAKKEYWEHSNVVAVSEVSSTEAGLKTTTTIENNEDGTQRTRTVAVTGRQSGSVTDGTKVSYYNSKDELVYEYEYVEDLQKEEISGVYRDASGAEIGHDRVEKEDGSWSELVPNGITDRKGELTGFTEKGADKDGNSYSVSYDRNMRKLNWWQSVSNEDGDTVTSYFTNQSEKPYMIRTNYIGGSESVSYDRNGTEVASTIADGSFSNAILGTKMDYYNQEGELTYSRLNYVTSVNKQSMTVFLDAAGKEIGRLEVKDNGDYSSLMPVTTYANNIYGYHESLTSDDGKVQIRREYTTDGELEAEHHEVIETVYADDMITTTVQNKAGTVIRETTELLDEDLETVKKAVTYYNSWDGSLSGRKIHYTQDKAFTDDVYAGEKYYDKNDNLTKYGWTWDDNDYDITELYWVNGRPAEWSWADRLDAGTTPYGDDAYGETHVERYNPDGSYYYWEDVKSTGAAKIWNYSNTGRLYSYEDRIANADGSFATNVTFYDRSGNVSGYEWNIRETGNAVKWEQDSTVWDADRELYSKHMENDPYTNECVETWTDKAGNTKVIRDDDHHEATATVSLADTRDGWHNAFGDEWYYVEKGKLATGWKQLDGEWYLFGESGEMMTGLAQDSTKATFAFDDAGVYVENGWLEFGDGNWAYVKNGSVATGWQQINGDWYYFSDGWNRKTNVDETAVEWERGVAGYMATGAASMWNSSWTDTETYFFNEDGTWDNTPGWKSNGIDEYYYDESGNRASGWQLIDNEWYFFNKNGVMKNGWVGGNGPWYYLNETGEMAVNQWVRERFEDDWYYADENGTIVTKWREIDGNWYYFGNDGVMAEDEWVFDHFNWYYQDQSGAMTVGWKEVDDDWYYMDASGVMQTGWQQVDGTWYNLGNDGAMKSEEWVQSGKNWYYMDQDGAMSTGWTEVEDSWYHMTEDGVMESNAWIKTGNDWYYAGADGAMVTGDVEIGGELNHFDENGVWLGAD